MESEQELVDALMDDFEKRGEVAIEDLKKNDISAYFRVIAEISRQEMEEQE